MAIFQGFPNRQILQSVNRRSFHQTARNLFGYTTKVTADISSHFRPSHPELLQKEKDESPFMIIRPDSNDFDEILDLMWKSYYRDEPMVKYLGLGRKRSNVFDEITLDALGQGLSLAAKCKQDGSIAGVAINEGSCPWDPDITDKFACTLSNAKMRQLFQFYAYVQRAPDLWKQTCSNKIFEVTNWCLVFARTTLLARLNCKSDPLGVKLYFPLVFSQISYLFVRADDRKRDIGTELVKSSIEAAADCTYQCVRLDASAASW